jgi:hypothetical protein
VYTFSEIAELVELPGAFMIGAGAGPHRHVGCCEVNINMFKPFILNSFTLINYLKRKIYLMDNDILLSKP